MRHAHVANTISRVWLTPDLGLGFHYFDYSRSQYDGLPHMHGEYCVVMCLSGALEVVRGEQLDLLQEGEIIVVNPGEIHRCRFGVDGQHSSGFSLILRPSSLRPLLAAMTMSYGAFARDFRFLGKTRNPQVFEMVTKLIEEYREQRRGYAAMAESMVRQMLIHLLRD